MSDYKIAFFGVKSWERPIIEREIINLETVGVGIFEEELQDKLDIAKNYDIISTFIYSKVEKKVLDELPNLKMIATRSTGTDHIDCEECKRKKIIVMNVPVYGSNTVAEYAFALLLAVAKRIVPAHQSVEEGEFSPEGLTGVDVEGKTLGVIGVGKIGQNVVRIAKGFKMKVLGVEKTQDAALENKLGFKFVNLETLLKESDFVSLHLPATKETFHFINKQNIRLMKPGSILINVSRGAVIETEAILWALKNKILWGAGLDVTEEEDQVENISMVTSKRPTKDDLQEVLSYHLLRDRDDVVFTPHNAFNTQEAIGRIVKMTMENIKEFMKEGK
ncbi:MAG: NAD(P)-binding domain-containing protein [Candidatus Shapirobacteria bacterium]|nr:NAD(P)-binding domain-containing protein [Candidatus Shapirobacteria bacterium]